MTISLFVLVTVIIAALAFDFVNGFHDTANAIATVVSTKVLPLSTAIFIAAVLNFVGAFFGGGAVAHTITNGIVSPEGVSQVLILSALLGAIFWGMVTWYYGLPSSSSHAIIGGLVGAALAKSGVAIVRGEGLLKIVMILVTSPLVGFLLGFLVMVVVFWLCYKTHPKTSAPLFRWLQILSASFMALAHGNNDAQKSMGVITMSLVSFEYISRGADGHVSIPQWVVLVCALAMALGTASGGRRIIRTMGTKIIELRPVHGFAAETTASLTILGASVVGMPVSTTHVISAAILGVGSTQNPSAVRWEVAFKMIVAWILTLPISALVSAVFYVALSTMLGR
ncbi:MAG: inorganic phosphate transporter [Bdellovibrionota bacterium]